MKKFSFLTMAAALIFFTACQQNNETTSEIESRRVTDKEILEKIAKHGFSTENVLRTEDGYLVEGDICLTASFLNSNPTDNSLRIAEGEHYHTTNLVTTNGTRTITVALQGNLPSNFVPALDEALDRYNAEDLTIKFKRVTSNADITIKSGPWWWNLFGILGQGGFPEGGDPYNQVQMNTSAFSSASTGYLATVLAHEIGHNIGFRHTDYMDRSISCGGSPDDEGEAGVGAIHIPGTPTRPSAANASWMLSCADGTDRPFNSNDKKALKALY